MKIRYFFALALALVVFIYKRPLTISSNFAFITYLSISLALIVFSKPLAAFRHKINIFDSKPSELPRFYGHGITAGSPPVLVELGGWLLLILPGNFQDSCRIELRSQSIT